MGPPCRCRSTLAWFWTSRVVKQRSFFYVHDWVLSLISLTRAEGRKGELSASLHDVCMVNASGHVPHRLKYRGTTVADDTIPYNAFFEAMVLILCF